MLFVPRGSDLSPSSAALIIAVDRSRALCGLSSFLLVIGSRILAPDQLPISKLSFVVLAVYADRDINSSEEHKPVRGTPLDWP